MALHSITTTATFTGAHATRLIGGAGTVGSFAISGLEAAGTVGGILGVVAAILTLWVTIGANNRAKRREYADEIDRAKTEGRRELEARLREVIDELTEARHERDFYRDQWAARGGTPPTPGGGT